VPSERVVKNGVLRASGHRAPSRPVVTNLKLEHAAVLAGDDLTLRWLAARGDRWAPLATTLIITCISSVTRSARAGASAVRHSDRRTRLQRQLLTHRHRVADDRQRIDQRIAVLASVRGG